MSTLDSQDACWTPLIGLSVYSVARSNCHTTKGLIVMTDTIERGAMKGNTYIVAFTYFDKKN